MTISAKTRKILWGHAASRCAICKCELVMDATTIEEEAIIGDECHIIAKQAGGPRADSTKPIEELDHHKNLILLCKVHHKLIDDQPQTYTAEILHRIKADHEKWVETSLESPNADIDWQNKLQLITLPRIRDAKEVVDIISTADSYWSDYETPENESELAEITEFLGEFEGLSYLSDEPVYLAEARFRIKRQIEKLEGGGYYLYGKLTHGKLNTRQKALDWKMGYIVLKRFDISQLTIGYNPSISF